jgi:hypothetical protein
MAGASGIYPNLKGDWLIFVHRGFISMTGSGTVRPVRLLAAFRMTTGSILPNDFSPPIASTGMVNLAAHGESFATTAQTIFTL